MKQQSNFDAGSGGFLPDTSDFKQGYNLAVQGKPMDELKARNSLEYRIGYSHGKEEKARSAKFGRLLMPLDKSYK